MIEQATATIARHEGARPVGWMSPWLSNSPVTMDLLQEAGYRYVMDWTMDDQPVWLRTRKGRILAVPYPIEVNDTRGIVWYRYTADEFADMIVDQFDEMLAQSAGQPLVCPISLHPFVIGRPYRIRRLRRALQHILGHGDRVWLTRPRDICAHVESLPAGVVPGSGVPRRPRGTSPRGTVAPREHVARMRRWAKRIAGALAVFVLILAAPILWVEVACTTAREPGTLTRAPLVEERGYARRESDSYLSYPEWHIVYAYEDLAGVLRRGDESDFAYGRQIAGFWTNLCGLTRVVTARGPVGTDTKVMLYTIGWSFTAELAIKGAYETTVGHAFERLRGHAKTAEDEFAARDMQAYAEFLRQTPWYEYPFGWRLLAFWRSTPLRGDGLARKIERRGRVHPRVRHEGGLRRADRLRLRHHAGRLGSRDPDGGRRARARRRGRASPGCGSCASSAAAGR